MNQDSAPTSPSEVVRAGYDATAEAYLAARAAFDSTPHLERLAATLAPGATILDLGCGAGVPVARWLTERGFDVEGIDVSERQIDLARRLVPAGRFAVRDMLTVPAGEFRVQAVAALYSVFHVSRDSHAELFARIRSWLPVGGTLLVTMGSTESEGFEEAFFGARMWWSHFGRERNREIVEAAGFDVVFEAIDERADERHQVLLAVASG